MFITEASSGPALRTAESAFPVNGDDLLRIGLDLSVSMLAPCLLGCSGTPREHALSAARRGCELLHMMAGPGIIRYQVKKKNRT